MALKKFSEQQEIAESYLKTAEDAKKQADRTFDEINELKRIKDGLKAVFSDGAGSLREQAPYVAVCEKIDLWKKKILQDNKEYLQIRIEITKQINKVTDSRYNLILKKRYLDFKSMENIADEIHYSRRRLNDLHKEALDAFYEANEKSFH